MDALPGLTWRRFCVLIAGLPADAALVNVIAGRRQEHGKGQQYVGARVVTINADREPERLNDLFKAMSGRPRSVGTRKRK